MSFRQGFLLTGTTILIEKKKTKKYSRFLKERRLERKDIR